MRGLSDYGGDEEQKPQPCKERERILRVTDELVLVDVVVVVDK